MFFPIYKKIKFGLWLQKKNILKVIKKNTDIPHFYIKNDFESKD